MIEGYNGIVIRFRYSDHLLSLFAARTAIIATLYPLK
jgi:hypothetical protein